MIRRQGFDSVCRRRQNCSQLWLNSLRGSIGIRHPLLNAGLGKGYFMKLGRIAHSRTGDKGNSSNISVIAYDVRYYRHLCEHLTAQRVKAHFADIVKGEVTRYELPSIAALNFVLTDALEGGVTRSIALDAHGKGLSSALLSLELPELVEPS
jgi:hypothetical protein